MPDTVLYPEAFKQSQWDIECPYCKRIIGFDGVFDWGWVIEAIREADKQSKIMPMDFDAVVERHHHYLIFETKDENVEISQAQLWTLDRLKKARSFTVMKVWGKTNPNVIEINTSNGRTIYGNGIEDAKRYVKCWFQWANK